MLVLKRKKGESIFIGGVTVSILKVGESAVTISVVGPKEIKVLRSEIIEKDPEVLVREDRSRDAYIARLKKMSPEKREKVIARIVKEFCSPKATSLQTETPAACG
jgi:carbon storage regulator CsrA